MHHILLCKLITQEGRILKSGKAQQYTVSCLHAVIFIAPVLTGGNAEIQWLLLRADCDICAAGDGAGGLGHQPPLPPGHRALCRARPHPLSHPHLLRLLRRQLQLVSLRSYCSSPYHAAHAVLLCCAVSVQPRP